MFQPNARFSRNDLPRESIPTVGRDFGLVWSVSAGISGVYRTQHTQLATSNDSPFEPASSGLSVSSFSGPPFTSEGETRNCSDFSTEESARCTARASIWSGPAVRVMAEFPWFFAANPLRC